MLVNNLVLKTIYEARENDDKVSKALRKVEVTSDEIKQALEFLRENGLIENNKSMYTVDKDGKALNVYDVSAIVTEKGVAYLEENNII